MKTLIAILFLLAGTALNAQLQLEQSYLFSGTLTEIDEGEFKYFVMDVPLNQCRIYNEDHSLYKTINLSVPAGYYLSDIKFLSRKTFNQDENIELLYICYKIETLNSQLVYTYAMKVVSETGTVLLNLTNGGYAEIKVGTDGPKLLAYQYIWNQSYYLVYTNVYALETEATITEATSTKGLRVFPNPAENYLNIEARQEDAHPNGKLTILDLNGKELISEQFNGRGERIILNTEGLPAGAYILNVIHDDGIRSTEKIVIK